MGTIGYREIYDFGELSLKQLNDNLRALWRKVMGEIEYRDLASATQDVIEAKADTAVLSQYARVTQTNDAITAAVHEMHLERYSTIVQTAAAITAALADSAGTTKVSIAPGYGLKVSMSEIASYFQASAEKFGLYNASDDTPFAEAGVEEGQGYFAVTRLKNALVSSSFLLELLSETVTPPSTYINGAAHPVYGLGFRHGATRTGSITTEGQVDDTPTGIRIKAYTGQVALESPLAEDEYSGSSAYFTPLDLYMESRCGEGNDLFLHLDTVNDRIYASRALTVSSDARHKSDIQPLRADEWLDRLRPVSFLWKNGNGKRSLGFIAQEVRDTLAASDLSDTDIVSEDKHGFLSIAYEQYIPLLVARVQRQSAQIRSLQETVETLIGRIARLEN